MILPQSYAATLIVMIVALLCLGSWANTFKMRKGWRFELYYFDFAVGILLAALILAFTVGSMGFDGFSFTDDLLHAGKRQWFYGFLAGVIFNLANMLLMGALSISGMSIAFPLAIGTGLVVSSLLNQVVTGQTNLMLIAAGSLMIILAIVAGAAAFSGMLVHRHEQLARSGKAKSTRRPTPVKGIILCLASGLFMGMFGLLVHPAMASDAGLGPYSLSTIFAVGMAFSTIAFNIFFVNLPVEGEPTEIGEYFKIQPKTHLLGLAGGAIWSVGATAALVAAAAQGPANLGSALNFGLAQGFAVVAALWGLLKWKELAGADMKAKGAAVLMLVFYICGLALLSVAPMFLRKG